MSDVDPGARPELSCIMPAFNEEACIREVLLELTDKLDRRNIPYEIIVVDNGSRDGTTRILEEFRKDHPTVRTLRFEENQGYGGGIIAGFEVAQGNVIGFTSADGEVMPESVVQMYDLIKSGQLDFCKAKRINRKDGFYRKILSFNYHLLVGLLFKIHITDINGYPLFMTRQAYQQLRLTKKNWIINIEILVQARRKGFMSAEVDVRHRKRFGGASHIRWFTSAVMFALLFRYWWSLPAMDPESPPDRA